MNAWAVASLVLGIAGVAFGGFAVCLLGAFYGNIDGLPEALSALVVVCLFAAIPLGILASMLAGISFAFSSPPRPFGRWGLVLGLSAIVVGLFGLYLGWGASLNTIGP